MKKLYFLLLPIILFFSERVIAQDSGINPEQAANVLADALKIAAGIPGIVGAVFASVFVGIYGIIMIAKIIQQIANYFNARDIRERESYEYSLKIRKQQEENLERMQKDACEAIVLNMDLAYKQDYDYYVKKIKEEKYSSVYLKINTKFHDDIKNFIYGDNLTAEEKSALIIKLVRE